MRVSPALGERPGAESRHTLRTRKLYGEGKRLATFYSTWELVQRFPRRQQSRASENEVAPLNLLEPSELKL